MVAVVVTVILQFYSVKLIAATVVKNSLYKTKIRFITENKGLLQLLIKSGIYVHGTLDQTLEVGDAKHICIILVPIMSVDSELIILIFTIKVIIDFMFCCCLEIWMREKQHIYIFEHKVQE